MSKRNRRTHHTGTSMSTMLTVPDTLPAQPGAKAEVFSFGDPVPVLDRRELLDYIECWQHGKWYETPISMQGLARSFRAAPYHSSAIYVKRNILASTYIPHPALSRGDFANWSLNFLTFGNGYLERLRARSGRLMQLKPALSKYVRRGVKDLDQYYFVRGYGVEHAFEPGSIFHLMEPDIHQEIYGLPEYLSALQSAFLNESATLFRRRYYNNGSHAGFILYMSDPSQNEEDINAVRKALKESKGVGNFKNLFVYSPNGKKDGIQLIPISEVAAKDEFTGIKTASRDDMLAAHRVPPQLLGILPNNTSGFGDVVKASQVFAANELRPLQARFAELNEWAGEEIIRFGPYVIDPAADPKPPVL